MRKTSGCKKVSLRAALKTLEGLLLPPPHSHFWEKTRISNKKILLIVYNMENS